MPSSITVRKVDFDFPEDIDLYVLPSYPRESLYLAAFSLIVPYVEQFAIRTMTAAKERITDDDVLQDLKKFTQQEGNHYRSHERINRIIRTRFDEDTEKKIEQLESDIKSDYNRFTKEKTLKFNLAYIEGFEAMTCAWALAMTKILSKPHKNITPGWRELLDWHGLEEIEHRVVAFRVYNNISGDYLFRVICGAISQIHYLRQIHLVYSAMLRAKGFTIWPYIPQFIKAGGMNYLNSFTPWYDPAKYELPQDFEARINRYGDHS